MTKIMKLWNQEKLNLMYLVGFSFFATTFLYGVAELLMRTM